MTDDDCVVLLGGCDDKNPEKLTTELNTFLTCLSHTNVIVSEIPVNRFLNEHKLNYQINFTCKKYNNAVYMDLNYSRVIPKLRDFVIHLGRSLLKEILSINYKQNFSKYKLSLPIETNTCKQYRDIGTQTLNTESKNINCNIQGSNSNNENDINFKNINSVQKIDNCINYNNLFRL